MSEIKRCGQCNRLFQAVALYSCDICGVVFCSPQCKLVHKCEDLPDLIEPWEEESAIDLTDVLALFKTPDLYCGNRLIQPDNTMLCYRCRKEKALWNRLREGPPVCLNCYRELRKWFLSLLGWSENNGIVFIEGYRICRLNDETIFDSTDCITLLRVSYKLAKFKIVDIHIQSRGLNRDIKLKISDLCIVNIDQATILFIADRILEFIPGTYVIIAEKGI